MKQVAREQFQALTEPMYYILISLLKERCGVEILLEEYRRLNVMVNDGLLYMEGKL